MSTHAKYSASSLARLAICPASARMSEGIPDKSSPDAERGTRIHELGELILTKSELPTEVAQDELQLAQEYADYVNAIPGDATWFELSVNEGLEWIHPDLGGTADAVVHDPETQILHVIDLKTGRSPVAAKGNEQLMTYALGAIKVLGLQKELQGVRLHIFQPGNTSTHDVHEEEFGLWLQKLAAITRAADDPTSEPMPSSKGCWFCKAKPHCEALRQYSLSAARQDFKDETLSLETLLDQAEIAGVWADSVKELAKTKLSNGETAGHWVLKPGRKLTNWANKVGAEAYFAGEPRYFEIKSPAALRKAGGVIPEEMLEVKQSAPSLARKENDLG